MSHHANNLEPVTAVQAQSPRAPLMQALQHIPSFLRLYLRLFVDGRVGLFAKLLLFAAVAYVVSPLDILPDLAPILGQVDDVSILLLACRTFLGLCPPAVVQEHVQRIDASGRWKPLG